MWQALKGEGEGRGEMRETGDWEEVLPLACSSRAFFSPTLPLFAPATQARDWEAT